MRGAIFDSAMRPVVIVLLRPTGDARSGRCSFVDSCALRKLVAELAPDLMFATTAFKKFAIFSTIRAHKGAVVFIKDVRSCRPLSTHADIYDIERAVKTRTDRLTAANLLSAGC
jgi:hypothetical protein